MNWSPQNEKGFKIWNKTVRRYGGGGDFSPVPFETALLLHGRDSDMLHTHTHTKYKTTAEEEKKVAIMLFVRMVVFFFPYFSPSPADDRMTPPSHEETVREERETTRYFSLPRLSLLVTGSILGRYNPFFVCVCDAIRPFLWNRYDYRERGWCGGLFSGDSSILQYCPRTVYTYCVA